MFTLMLVFASFGALLFLAAAPLAELLSSVAGDVAEPGGVAHLLRIAGALLLFGAILARPHNPETAAFPPPPDATALAR